LLGKPAFQMTIQESLEAIKENSDCSRGHAAQRFDAICTLPYDENQPLAVRCWSFVTTSDPGPTTNDKPLCA